MLKMDNKEEIDLKNTFKILVASDMHLGFKETDSVRGNFESLFRVNYIFSWFFVFAGNDSFNTFHEILKNAEVNEVDFIIFCGDLFHDIQPSTQTMVRYVK